MSQNLPAKPDNEMLLCQTKDGQTCLETRLQDETVWLSQKLMAKPLEKNVRTIGEHIKNILAEGEQLPEGTIQEFWIAQLEGNREVA